MTPALDEARAWTRMGASMTAFCRAAGGRSPRGSLYEADGVLATVVPEAPDRSVVNAVVYDDAKALARALEDLADIFERAGVRAWTVWVPGPDREGAALVEHAGHRLDAAPAAMVLGLDGFERPAGDLDWTREGDIETLTRINDDSYPFPDRPWSKAFSHVPEGARVYLAHLNGEPASGLLTFDWEGDCAIELVATAPGARGQGLAGTLLAHALADARDRGQEASTLQATEMGRPVYERLGYRSIGAYEMWERRAS